MSYKTQQEIGVELPYPWELLKKQSRNSSMLVVPKDEQALQIFHEYQRAFSTVTTLDRSLAQLKAEFKKLRAENEFLIKTITEYDINTNL